LPDTKQPVLENITMEELELFCSQLSSEKDFLTNPLSRQHQFFVGVRQNGEVVAIGGLKRYFGIFHFSFFVVRAEFQRKGFGSAVKKELFKYARKKHYPAIFAAIRRENTASLQTNYRLGYKAVYKSNSYYILAYPLNRFGKSLVKVMPRISIIIGSYFQIQKLRKKTATRPWSNLIAKP
jgi:ribosomal protein S18 acetylase RimI-like enzyme